MKFKKREVVREYNVIQRRLTRCDICNNLSHDVNDDIEIKALIGSCFPEGDFREGYELDLCGDCFLEKVKPLIENNLNVKFRCFSADDRESDRAEYV